MRRLNPFNLNRDGIEFTTFEAVRTASFQAAQQQAFEDLAPGENASNDLARGIGWGVYAQDKFIWLDRNTYWLSKKDNPEEGGRVRRFRLINRAFLERPDTEAIIRACFGVWKHREPPSHRAYEVQLSFIRYEPTIAKPALPSPIIPHHDKIDGGIIVLNKTGDLVGGVSRIYSRRDEPLFEFDLAVGECLFIKDRAVKHQVTPLQLSPGPRWRPGDRAYRDIMIVRYQPVGR